MASLYSALPSSNSIRLLCLQPGVFEEQISSSLVVVNEFPPSDEYFAISYCWGDANDTTTLSCNNTLVPVTKSLYAALHRLRDKTHPLLIWADAICINQRDISERNQQILMMRQIYSGASCVYIWTGPGDISSTRALDLIESISHNCFKAIYGQDSSPSSWLGKLRKEQDRTQVVMNTRLTDLLPLRGISPSAWHMIWQFFQREWFFRVWVIQEVQACPNTWLLCGEKTIEWDHVVLAANWTLYAPYRDNTINWKVHHFPTYGGFHNAFFMWDQSLRTRREAPFPALLDLVRPFRASDPRDKVFAMLQSPLEQVGKSSRLENTDDRVALSTLENVSSNHLNMRADYNIDTREVYRQVIAESVQNYQNLEVLCYAWQTAYLDLSWPSWIPRWDVDNHGSSVPLLPFLYDAAGRISPSCYFREDTLVVQGLNLGPVTETSPIYTVLQKSVEQEVADFTDSTTLVQESLTISSQILVQDQWQDVPGDEITAERASKCPQVHFADFCAYLLPRLQIYRQDIYIPVDSICCDECFEIIIDKKTPTLRLPEQFRCDICANGDYDLCAKCFGQGKRCKDPKHPLTRTVATSFWCPYTDQIIELLKAHASPGNADRFHGLCKYACARRMFIRLANEWRGVGPFTVREGDIVVVLFGSRVPFVLRQQGDTYRLIGDCYMHGLMDGEAIQMWKDNQLRVEEFRIR